MITLRSFERMLIEASAEKLAVRSAKIKKMLDDGAEMKLDVPVGSKILSMAIDYCTRHADDELSSLEKYLCEDEDDDVEYDDNHLLRVYREYLKEKLPDLDPEFQPMLEEENQGMLFELIRAAAYLDIRSLLDLLCPIILDKINGKSLEEIHRSFNMKFEFTEEDTERLDREFESVRLEGENYVYDESE